MIVSGTEVVRPCGQQQADREDPKRGSVYGLCKLLDIELQIAIFVDGPTPPLGRAIKIEEAEEFFVFQSRGHG